jgi:hypothetical protein
VKEYIELDKFGYEYESSRSNVKSIAATKQFYTKFGVENSKIHEARSKPVGISDFKKVLEVWNTIYSVEKSTCFNYVEGVSDKKAGSIHTHISYKKGSYEDITKKIAPVLMAASPILLSKNSDMTFRDRFHKGGLCKFVKIPTNGKYYIKIHSAYSTTEVRLNETFAPMWMYLIPIIEYNMDMYKFTEYYYDIFRKLTEVDDVPRNEAIVTPQLSTLTEVIISMLLGTKEQVLTYWKSRMSEDNYEAFKRALNVYYNVKFNNKDFITTVFCDEERYEGIIAGTPEPEPEIQFTVEYIDL